MSINGRTRADGALQKQEKVKKPQTIFNDMAVQAGL